MRTIDVSEITENIKEMCMEANHYLSKDMDVAMKKAAETEESPLGKQILLQLQENLQIAAEDRIPICQEMCIRDRNGKWRSGRGGNAA